MYSHENWLHGVKKFAAAGKTHCYPIKSDLDAVSTGDTMFA